MCRLLAVGGLALAGCGSSFAHSPTPRNLRDCIAQTVKPRSAPVVLASAGSEPAGSAVEFVLGGPFQRDGADVEAPSYSVDVYLFDSAAAARRASDAIRPTQNKAGYVIGRAVVVDSVGSIGPTPAGLPQPTRAAVRNCLRATGYL